MVFSSWLFLFYFLPASLLLYYAAPRRGRHLILTVVSYVFYGWANPLFTVLLFVSTLIDYVCGLVIDRARAGTAGLTSGPTSAAGPTSKAGPPSKAGHPSRARLALIASICSNL